VYVCQPGEYHFRHRRKKRAFNNEGSGLAQMRKATEMPPCGMILIIIISGAFRVSISIYSIAISSPVKQLVLSPAIPNMRKNIARSPQSCTSQQ
jgi:hypothetical protein